MNMDQIVYEDKNEHFGFTQIPNVVLTSTVLNPTEKCVYGILRRYASMPKGAMPSVAMICLEANISNATYKRAIKTFIRSSRNPKPKIPLITAIQRPNDTSVFKIHKITDQLTEILESAIAMSKKEREEFRESFRAKKKGKGGAQNEPSTENNREAQNEPPKVGLKMNPLEGSKRTPSNIEVSNIDNNKQEQKKDVVVASQTPKDKDQKQEKEKNSSTVEQSIITLQEKFKKAFGKNMSKTAAKTVRSLLVRHGKQMDDVLSQTVAYFKSKGEPPQNPVGALRYEIETGWDVEEVVSKRPKREKRNYDRIDPTTLLIQQRMKELAKTGGDQS